MKQRWVLQGKTRSEPNGGWITLSTHRTRKGTRINKVRERARRLDVRADYRAILVTE